MNFTRKRVLIVVLLWTFIPILSTVLGGGVALCCGCQLDEGSVHPCIIFGIDFGGVLYALGMGFWLIFLTLPTGLIMLALLAFDAARRKRIPKSEA